MPDKPLDENASLWINYMRALKKKYPELEYMSRKIGYPIMAPYYQKWKNKYYDKNKSKIQLLITMVNSIQKLPNKLKING